MASALGAERGGGQWECNECGSEQREVQDSAVVCARCSAVDPTALPEAAETMQGVHSQREHHRRPQPRAESAQPRDPAQSELTDARAHCERHCTAIGVRASSLIADCLPDPSLRGAALRACRTLLARLLRAADAFQHVLQHVPVDSSFRAPQLPLRRACESLFPSHSVPLALALLSLHALREPVMASDLVRWALDGSLDLFGSARSTRFSSAEQKLLQQFSPSRVPSGATLRKVSSLIRLKLTETHQALPIPPLDVPCVIFRLCCELDMPQHVHTVALRVNRMVGTSLLSHMPITPIRLKDVPPDAHCAGCVAAAIKLCFGLGVWREDNEGNRIDGCVTAHDENQCKQQDESNLPVLESLLAQFHEKKRSSMRVPHSVRDAHLVQNSAVEPYSELCMNRIFNFDADAEERYLATRMRESAQDKAAAGDDSHQEATAAEPDEEALRNEEVDGIYGSDDSAASSGREDGKRAMNSLRTSMHDRSIKTLVHAQLVQDVQGKKHSTIVPLRSKKALFSFLMHLEPTHQKGLRQARKAHVDRVFDFIKNARPKKRKLIWYHGALIRYGIERWDASAIGRSQEQAVIDRANKTKMFEKEQVDAPREFQVGTSKQKRTGSAFEQNFGKLNAGEGADWASECREKSKQAQHILKLHGDAESEEAIGDLHYLQSFRSTHDAPKCFVKLMRILSETTDVTQQVRQRHRPIQVFSRKCQITLV